MSLIKKIAVLMGGWSAERDVSLRSGDFVAKNLIAMGYDVVKIDVKKDLQYITNELFQAAPDFVFNVMHGTGGEDGVIQGVLELFGVPYTNSNVLGSALSFEKDICKTVIEKAGIKTADWFSIGKEDIKKLGHEITISYPCVIKPASSGSSIGVFLIFSIEDLKKFQETEWLFGEKIVIEQYIKGREITAAVMNGKFLGAIEIVCKESFFDYHSKYDLNMLHIPIDLSDENLCNIGAISEKIFKTCACSGLIRVDYIYDNNDLYFLETNTQPGFTENSLAPDIAKMNDISIEDFLNMHIRKS